MAESTDIELARRIATEAGALLTKLREGEDAPSGRELKDAGDKAAQDFLAAELAAHRPADAVLSEEAADDKARLDASRVWIVDPLDGTREYSEHRHDWAVHVALWGRAADGLIAGAVALPGAGVTLDSAGAQTSGAVRARPRLAVSRSRPPSVASEVAEELDADLVPMGSAGYKIAAVIRGEAEAYVHAGGQYEWDSAAPIAVAEAAGLHTSRLDGSPLRYNRPDPYLPDLVVCRPELADRILKITNNHARSRRDDDSS